MIKKLISLFLVFSFLTVSAFSFSVEILNTDPSPITVGDYADVTVRFSNDKGGDDKEDVSFGLDESEFFYVINKPDDFISNVYEGEYFTRTFRIFFSEDLEQGEIELPFYVLADGIKETFENKVFVKDSLEKPRLFIGSVKSIPNELLPDTDDNKIIVTLQNLGDKDADLVSAKLVVDSENVDESYSYSMQDSVASIKGGEQQELEFVFDLDKNVNSDIDAKLELNYRFEKAIGNSYDVKTENLDLTLKISDAPLLEISNVELVDSFEAGSIDNRLRVEIKNVGNSEAEDVRIRLSPDISYPLVYNELTQYVTSKIPVGESRIVEFKIEVLDSADPRSYGVTANLESIVGDSRYSNDAQVEILVKAGESRDIPTTGKTAIAIILIISIVIGYRTFKGSKN